MKINLILDRLLVFFNVKTSAELAGVLGISATAISNWKARNTIDYDLIFTKCESVNFNWLLTGDGNMYNNDSKGKIKEPIPCPPPIITNCKSCEAKDATIQAMKTTIETQAKYIKLLEAQSPTEVGQQKKQESNLVGSDEGQKRKEFANK